jgi:hypothetical protein
MPVERQESFGQGRVAHQEPKRIDDPRRTWLVALRRL